MVSFCLFCFYYPLKNVYVARYGVVHVFNPEAEAGRSLLSLSARSAWSMCQVRGQSGIHSKDPVSKMDR